jgi:hypothetical protein
MGDTCCKPVISRHEAFFSRLKARQKLALSVEQLISLVKLREMEACARLARGLRRGQPHPGASPKKS